ncbi:MAG: ROK family transcriptional regulator [Ruminococcaceae bacterium]|nr:ROK family transcriptional regulator [Oscillospiraceae bacterium]
MAERKGLNNTHLKYRNRGIALQLIASAPLSRADITKRMGLTKMAITNIVGELIEEGYITETETEEKISVGRNPVLLDIAPKAPIAAGVYISRNEVCVLLSDIKLHAIYMDKKELSGENSQSLVKKIFAQMDAALSFLSKHHPNARVLGIGVSSIGPLDPENGVILHPTSFFGISNLPIAKLLTERYHLPVTVGNDMDASALAEKLYGKGSLYDAFLYLGIANGIGSGIIFNRRLYHSGGISGGEIGHMCINFDGPLCNCGNKGCLEMYANMPVILNKMTRATGLADITAADFETLASDPRCDAILHDMAEKLSVALVNAVNLLDSQCVIIGHEGAFIPLPYLKQLEESLNRRILGAGYRNIPVIRSHFGNRAPLMGSVALIFEKLFGGEFFET